MMNRKNRIGIDDMSLYVPAQYVPISELAAQRGIEFPKLKYGLGLDKMAFPAPNEDAATMAAEAIYTLMQKNKLVPAQIGRIYLGTESAVDGAKPTATYAVQMVEQGFKAEKGFQHCDVVDMTFACIGAVDALQNSLDWVRCNPNQIAIVVASDFAKYELNSSGEYTQGSGAIALLIKAQPRLLSFGSSWGVGMESVHDFFKPRRLFSKKDLKKGETWPFEEEAVHLFRETPVFDGQFSNACYTNRVLEAKNHFIQQVSISAQNKDIFKRWVAMAFHLPYAAHARRIGADLYALELERVGTLSQFCKKNKIEKIELDADKATKAAFMKAFAKSKGYEDFVQEKLDFAQQTSGEVGNMYTASIFLALMAILDGACTAKLAYAKKKIGFFAYGSGSKAKVFEATVELGWEKVATGLGLKQQLDKRYALDFTSYEKWHNSTDKESTRAADAHRHFFLKHVDNGKGAALLGTRTYRSK